jgi:hypothetical protein
VKPARVGAALGLAALALAACGTTVPVTDRQAGPGGGPLGDVLTTPSAPAGSADSADSAPGSSTASAVGTTRSLSAPNAGRGPAPSAGPVGGDQPSTALAATGRGWTADKVFIGVTEIRDQAAASDSVGLKAIATGDQEVQANAVADHLNARGGLFGRKVVMVFDNHATADIAAQQSVEAQKSCTKFTQDTPVVAVINTQTTIETQAYRACLAKAGVPLFGVSVSVMDDQVLNASNGLYFPVIVPTWDRFASFFVDRLKALSYFSPWDADAGGPGRAPVKVGAYIRDDPASERVYQLAAKAFAAAGHKPVTVFRYSQHQDASNAVLQFRAAGVTHLFGLDHLFFIFATQAESQHYRPRYALHSSNAMGVLMQENAPQAQNVGAVGVGTAPSMDIVGNAGDITPASKLCRGIMKSRGETFNEGGLPQTFAFALCDAIRAAVAGFTAGGGLSGEALRAGIGAVGPTFPPAVTFASGLSATSTVFPAAARDIAYLADCRCYRYLSPPRRF